MKKQRDQNDAKVKDKKKASKDSEHTSNFGDGTKNSHSQRSSSERNGKKSGKHQKMKHHSSYFGFCSCLSLLNIFLLLMVIFAAGTCLFLYSEGDLSVNGFHKAWPRIKENSQQMASRVFEAITIENISAAASSCYISVQPYLEKLTSIGCLWICSMKNLILYILVTCKDFVIQICPSLSPLWDTVVESWVKLTSDLWGFIFSSDWTAWKTSFGKPWLFVREQFSMLAGEFWKNEAMVSLWQLSKPVFVQFSNICSYVLERSVWAALVVCQTTVPVSGGICSDFFETVKHGSDWISSAIY